MFVQPELATRFLLAKWFLPEVYLLFLHSGHLHQCKNSPAYWLVDRLLSCQPLTVNLGLSDYPGLPVRQRRQWHPTPVLLPGKSHGWRSLVGCSPWVANSWTQLSDFTFTFHFYALEKEMATHSSVLACRIPGTGEPGRLPSMGSHRVGHN